MNQYTSSVIKKYGDSENVPQDVKTIFEILDRQGSSILIDCLAEKVGAANSYSLKLFRQAGLKVYYHYLSLEALENHFKTFNIQVEVVK